jgi:diguanylate cyclase (GGDEF)-like protein
MTAPAYSLLLVGIAEAAFHAGFATSPFGPYVCTAVDDAAAALATRAARDFDAVLIDVDRLADARALVRTLARGAAVLLVTAVDDAESAIEWTRQQTQDLLAPADLASPLLARRVRAAIERKRIEREIGKAYATDLATGLPHRQQLVEHMSQLLALREREPAPMAAVVLRVEGFSTTEARLGARAADSLRRKIAVRLRAAVRASDVVAALDDESYAVLLGSLLAPADAERVAAKLAQLMMEPFSVGGVGVGVAVAVGIGQYPADGIQPEPLLRKAIGMALDEPAQGRIGMANFQETGAQPFPAANDE